MGENKNKKDKYRSPIWTYTLDAILLYIRTKGDNYCIKNDNLVNFQQFVSKHLNNYDTGGDCNTDSYGNVTGGFTDELEKEFSYGKE